MTVFFILAIYSCVSTAGAVVLDDTARVEVNLPNGTTVLLFGEYIPNGGKPTKFYYLPSNLELAKYADGTPQFLFLKFTGDDASSPQGALLHFLMTWGMSEPDKNLVQTQLRRFYPNAKIAGAVPMEIDEGGNFTIVSGTVDQGDFIHSGRAPVVAGARVAAATKMDATQAQLMDKTLQDMAIGDVSVSAFYTYKTLSPGVSAKIEIDWSRFHSQETSLEAKYTRSKGRGGLFGGGLTSLIGSKKVKRTYTEMREDIEFLREEGVISIEIDQFEENEVTKAVTDAVMQYFLNATSQLAEPGGEMPPPAAEEENNDPNIRHGHSYVYKESFIKQMSEQKKYTLSVHGRVPIRHAVTVTGNIGDWYEDVKGNKKNVDTVNLNDPFFTIRPINFILDLDAEDIFSTAINFVTINVRKNRGNNRPFEKHLTIDRKYFENNGVTISTSYARGDDTSEDVFEYQTVWSVRGGGQFPATPQWQEGSWESVNLVPPVRGRTIAVEADLGALQSADISRATVQIRYARLGKELEANINLSPGEGQPLKSERIVTDMDAKGYAYRIILNHKSNGKLVLPWSAKVEDDYVYVNIPEDLQNQESEIFQEAKLAGKNIIKDAVDNVLEQFDEL
jgi:hypothetical protein